MNHSEEVGGELFVAGGDATEVFTEEALDPIAFAIEALGEARVPLTIALGGDVWRCALSSIISARMVAWRKKCGQAAPKASKVCHSHAPSVRCGIFQARDHAHDTLSRCGCVGQYQGKVLI